MSRRHSAGLSGARGGIGETGGGSLKSDAISLYVLSTGPEFIERLILMIDYSFDFCFVITYGPRHRA